MKLSISNIAWDYTQNEQIYGLMKKYAFSGLEIAPTLIFPENPYSQITNAKKWADEIKSKYNFIVSSMQSIWYGRQEMIFGSESERRFLIEYTKEAINFAEAIGCKNLVFGSPKNRLYSNDSDYKIGIDFFRTIGDYAIKHNTIIAMEANPSIYGTNYINYTKSAIELIKVVNSKGFMLNLDIGTIIENKENIDVLRNNIYLISHVHISEPLLRPIIKRDLHKKIIHLLQDEGYSNYISIEMAKPSNIKIIEFVMEYVNGIVAKNFN